MPAQAPAPFVPSVGFKGCRFLRRLQPSLREAARMPSGCRVDGCHLPLAAPIPGRWTGSLGSSRGSIFLPGARSAGEGGVGGSTACIRSASSCNWHPELWGNGNLTPQGIPGLRAERAMGELAVSVAMLLKAPTRNPLIACCVTLGAYAVIGRSPDVSRGAYPGWAGCRTCCAGRTQF